MTVVRLWSLPLSVVVVVPCVLVLLLLGCMDQGHMQSMMVMGQALPPSGSIQDTDWSTSAEGATIDGGVLTYEMYNGFASYQSTFDFSAPSYVRWSGTITRLILKQPSKFLEVSDAGTTNGLFVYFKPDLTLSILVSIDDNNGLTFASPTFGVTLGTPTTLTFIFDSSNQLTVTTSDTTQPTQTQTFSLNFAVVPYTVDRVTIGDVQEAGIAGTVNELTIAAGSPSAAGTGDPVFHGFQGQIFQVHGYPGSYFNLFSTAHLQINARFTFLASGTCGYNFTQCWTHPGTYMDHIGLLWNDGQKSVRVEVMAGSHDKGLFVKVNDEAVSAPLTASIVGVGNVTTTTTTSTVATSAGDQGFHLWYPSSRSFRIRTDLLEVTFVNSDMFFNVEATILDSRLLQLGGRHTDLTNIADVHQQQSLINRNYGAVTASQHMHGFVGQTWRNIAYPSKRLYEGTVDDYVVSHVLAYDSTFNYYTPATTGFSGSAQTDISV